MTHSHTHLPQNDKIIDRNRDQVGTSQKHLPLPSYSKKSQLSLYETGTVTQHLCSSAHIHKQRREREGGRGRDKRLKRQTKREKGGDTERLTWLDGMLSEAHKKG